MDDVTNYMNNVGKPLEDQSFNIQVSYEELSALKALAQNPHPSYMQVPESARQYAQMFEELKEIVGYAQRKHFVNRDVGH